MQNKNCGCGPSVNPSGGNDFLLVKSTPSEAATCEPISGVYGDSTDQCLRQEISYDTTLNDFTFPTTQGSSPMQVCNPGIYKVGLWLYFDQHAAWARINAITGNVLTLVNRCEDNNPIAQNPDIGFIISKGATFIVSDAPDCSTPAEELERIQEALALAEQVCLPNLKQASSTAVIQGVGWINSDPGDISQGKCLKRIPGLSFRGSSPFLSTLKIVGANLYSGFRRLARDKATGEIVQLNNIENWPGLAGGQNQYFEGFTNQEGQPVGPGYIGRFFKNNVDESPSPNDPMLWPSFSNEKTVNLDLSGINNITGVRHNLDHYFAMVRLEIGCRADGPTLRVMRAQLNDTHAGKVCAATSADYLVQYNCISMPVKVMFADHKIKLELLTTGSVNYYYKVTLDGIFF